MSSDLTHSSELKNRLCSDFTIFFDEHKTHDAKCWAVNWSCSSRYAMASFSRKSRKKSESGKLLSNIQIYDTFSQKVIQKIDSTTVPLEMNQFIYIIEPHPYKENIAFSADYDGKITLWDIELGLILNTFVEKGSFFNCSTLELPCLDGRFSPDGYSFAISTFYGTFSIYGYGNRDPFDYTPIEQFYLTEHRRFEFDELLRIIDSATGQEENLANGDICNILRNKYPKQPRNSLEMLMRNGYFETHRNEGFLARKSEDLMEIEENKEENKGENTEEKDITREFDHLLFFKNQVFFTFSFNFFILFLFFNQNENHRSLLEKPLEELETQRLQILEKQRKQLQSSLEIQLQDHAPPPPSPQIKPIKKPLLPDKTLIKYDKTPNSDDIENGENSKENQNEKPEENSNQVPLKRLIRRSSPLRNTKETIDFDDPEDENWEVESNISLVIPSKKINTRTRTSSRIAPNHLKRTGPQTRGIQKKVGINDQDSDFPDKIDLDSEEEEEYDSSEQSLKGMRTGLRKKTARKSYMDDEFTEEYKEEDSFEYKEKKPRKIVKNSSNNPLKRRERPEESDFPDLLTTRRKKLKINDSSSSDNRRKTRKLAENSSKFLENSFITPQYSKPIRSIKPFSHGDDPFFYNRNIVCSRCLSDNPSRKCSSSPCDKYYHESCAFRRGLEKDDNHFFCFECWFLHKKPLTINSFNYDDFSRHWLDSDQQCERHYIPQIGDKVYYLFQGHEEFLQEYWELLDYTANIEEMLPFVMFPQLLKPSLCEVLSIEYGFPIVRNKKVLRKFESLNVFAKVLLKDLGMGISFSVQFCEEGNISGFLVMKDVYEYSMELVRSLESNQTISYWKNFQEHSGQILEVFY